MTKLNNDPNNNKENPKKILVKCQAKGGKKITQEDCEYYNQKDKAREKGREKPLERSAGRDAENKLCIGCDMYPPFTKM